MSKRSLNMPCPMHGYQSCGICAIKELAEAQQELEDWRAGTHADETGHLHRCAKVNDVWSCVKGCVVQERDEAKRKLAERECVEISCPAFTRAAEMWQNLLAEARREQDDLKATIAEIHAAIPATFYAGLGVPTFRVEELVRTWRNAIEGNKRLEADLAAMRGALERIAAPMHTFYDLASEKRRSIAAAALASSSPGAAPVATQTAEAMPEGWLATAREVVAKAQTIMQVDLRLLSEESPDGEKARVAVEALCSLLARPEVQQWAGR